MLLSYKNEAIDARTFIFEERFTREMLHLIYNKILSDFTEKCEKKKKKKGQGYKTRYLKKQRTKQYSISHRTNDVEKSEITKFCSLLKKKKTSTLDKVIKTANFKGGISTLSFVKLYVKLKKFLEVVSGVDVFYRDSLGDCEPHASICGIHVDTALIRHRSREQRRLWRVDPGQ